jgi:hypothetical protein
MRHLFTVAAVLAAISFTPVTTQANIFGLFGFDCGGGHNCGCASRCCGCGSGCGCGSCCEPACGCGPSCCEPACGCEPGCGCEPACGCGCGCFPNGRQYAGQMFSCGCRSYVPICPCTGPCGGCCQSWGCGGCCEPACGCECGSGCEPTCGTGCGSCCGPCQSHSCCLKHCGFCSGLGHVLSVLCCCSPCAGCSGETYWSEWHNDPPRCQDPCNCQGEWIGPGCCPSCGPCGGGYVGAQSCPCNSGGYAVAAPPVRSNTTMRPMVAQNSRPVQSQPARTASRPVVRQQTQVQAQANANRQQQTARPIQW